MLYSAARSKSWSPRGCSSMVEQKPSKLWRRAPQVQRLSRMPAGAGIRLARPTAKTAQLLRCSAATNPCQCTRRAINVSGDGANNRGRPSSLAHDVSGSGAWHILRHGLEGPMHKKRIEDWLQALTARRSSGLLFHRRVQRRNSPSNRSQPFRVKFAGMPRRN